MKRYLLIGASMLALAVPAGVLAAGTPNPASLAAQSCKQQQAQMGAALFRQTYGANAYGKCVSKANRNAQAAVQNAAKQCKAQQSDPGFAAAHSGESFDAFYGANSKAKGKGADADAYGNCVSRTAQAAVKSQTHALVSAAKTCKAQLAADKATFQSTYGSKANAFGVCVSKAAGKNA